MPFEMHVLCTHGEKPWIADYKLSNKAVGCVE